MKTPNPFTPLAGGLVCAIALLAFHHAQAAVLIYEPFSATVFTNGYKLSNAGVGGWNQGNSASSGNTQNSIVTNTAALSYIGLVTEPLTLFGTNYSFGVYRIPSDGASSRNVGKLLPSPVTSGTAYCSFLVNVVTAPTTNRALLFLCSSGGGFTITPASVWLDSSGRLLVGKNISVSPQSGATAALAVSNTFFAVLKYTYNAGSGDDEVALFLNPVPGASEPGSPTLSTTSGSDATTIVSLGLPQGRTSDQAFHGSTSGRIYMDEIRVGTNWVDVTPAVCAPGTNYTLTGSASLCLPHPGASLDLSGSEVGVDYQLKRNGVDVGSPTNGTGSPISFGLTTTAGIYTVTGSNTTSGCVYLMSGIAAVTVAETPAITSSPTPALGTNTVGEYRLYSVGATGTALTYQWRHAGTNITNGNGYSGVTTPNLTIYPAALSHAGNYDCVVSGRCSPPATSSVANLFMKLPANLTWAGDGTANLWDTTTANWTGGATVFANGDSVTINDSGNNTVPIDLVGPITPVAINATNNSKDFTIGTTTTGSLGGTATLTKSGTGKLTLTTSNSFVGKTTVKAGTLSIDNDAKLGAVPSGVFTADQLTLDGGALEFTATASLNAIRGTTLGAAGGTYDIPSGIIFNNAAAITGAGGLTKISPGTLTLSVRNTFSGNMTINDGVVVGATSQNLGGNSVFGPINASRTINVNNGASLSFNAGNIFAGGNTTVVTPAPHIIVNQGGTLRTVINDGNNFGKITLNGGTFALGIGHGPIFGAAILTDTITVGGSAASTITEDPFSLFSAANLGFSGSTVGITFNIADATGNADGDLIIDAPLRNAANTTVAPTSTSLVKTGAGTLILNDINLYTGRTIVNAGTLGGSGTIGGPVIINANGNLSPGTSIGVMTLTNTLTLNGTFTAEVQSPSSCDQVIGLASVNYGGTLAIVNNGPALTVTDAFPIFSATAYSGVFWNITPATPAAGLYWNTSTLTTDGILRISSTPIVNPTPANIVFSVSGATLTLNWPSPNTGWTLQAQTNSLAVGLTTNWVNVTGSEATNQMSFSISPSSPAVFYRMKLTVP